MTEVSSERTINLANYIDLSKIKQKKSSPHSLFYRKDKIEIKSIVNQLNKVPNISEYAKQDIPERFHFKKHHRIRLYISPC